MRVYKTKGPERLVHTPSVPMTDAMMLALRRAAAAAGTTVAAKARQLLQTALDREQAEKK